MANPTDIPLVRENTDEPTTDTYTDEAILALLDREGSVRAASYAIWRSKAAKYSGLVDTSESGSSRRNSQLASNALTMMKEYAPISEEVAQAATGPFTVGITRE
jgi:hypothetical protein